MLRIAFGTLTKLIRRLAAEEQLPHSKNNAEEVRASFSSARDADTRRLDQTTLRQDSVQPESGASARNSAVRLRIPLKQPIRELSENSVARFAIP